LRSIVIKNMKFLIGGLLLIILTAGPASAARCDEHSKTSESAEESDESEGHSIGHVILWYLPNRILDLLDIARLRVRAGPGFAVGVRATKFAQAEVGSYATLYAGLPGPRGRSLPKLPVGVETYAGVALSVAEASVSGGMGPDYSPSEIGAGFQLGVVGVDAGIDPLEILDLLAGVFGADVKEDDW
jgi:hypothetical protein